MRKVSIILALVMATVSMAGCGSVEAASADQQNEVEVQRDVESTQIMWMKQQMLKDTAFWV